MSSTKSWPQGRQGWGLGLLQLCFVHCTFKYLGAQKQEGELPFCGAGPLQHIPEEILTLCSLPDTLLFLVLISLNPSQSQ